ncbi:MAG TPA: prepilin-type N-terminal cleavage/methylation domain-containing protein, partial [Gemmatimonadaceae bacterium]|nr:prepilin-type N-terminal cleavage/methylation domain-containing protein [Gemmatimonadaceae bacterium]
MTRSAAVPRGMTVIELVVGLTVTALALTAGYATLGTMVDHRARIREEAAETVRAAAVRRAVADWLAGAYVMGVPMSPAFQVVDRRDRGRADDELSFLTTARTPLGAGGGVTVRLFVDRDARTPERG